jgi:hypothetical protein
VDYPYNRSVVQVKDTAGNTYAKAMKADHAAQGTPLEIWYAKNIVGGANTVKVGLDAAALGNFDVYFHEYSGADLVSPLDVTASSIGVGTALDSGPATTNFPNELIFGYEANDSATLSMPGSTFTGRRTDAGNLTEDKTATTIGSYSATATINFSGHWIMAMATFKPPGTGTQVSSRSDTLSDSRPSATSNHTVAFTVNNSILGSSVSNSSTITLALPGFSAAAGMECGDVDVATGSQFNFNWPACQATATAWGFSATGSLVTLIPPSDTAVHVVTGTPVTIKIGSNATVGQQGAHWITNPSTGGIYTISVGGTFGASGNMLVSINAGVSVQATVAESLSFTVSPSVTSIKFVQANFTNPVNKTASSVTFSSNNTAGNLIILALDWNSQAVSVLSVTDTKGNVYSAAAPPVNGDSGNLGSWRDQIFYAKNIGGGANTVNVEFSGAVTAEIYIHEYSGADQSSPLDVTASSVGASATPDSGSKTTNFPNELVFGYCQGSVVSCTQGTNFATRRTDNGNLSEDMIATSTRSYSASANLAGSNDWIMSMATFRPGPGCIGDDGAAVNAIATTATSVPFGIISPNTFYQGCQDLIVSTNAGNGYSVTVQESSAMRTVDGRFSIPDTTCDGGTCSESTAAAWANATKNGFGHTCFNQSMHDCNAAYSSGTNFRQFANIAGGETAQAVMSSSTAATATGRVKYRLSAGSGQVAGTYTTIITYTIYATY